MYHLLISLGPVLIHQRASECLQGIQCYATQLESLEASAIAVCSKTSNHSVERHVQATTQRTFPITSAKVGSGPRVIQFFSFVDVECSGLALFPWLFAYFTSDVPHVLGRQEPRLAGSSGGRANRHGISYFDLRFSPMLHMLPFLSSHTPTPL
jgi:hypothetical protein